MKSKGSAIVSLIIWSVVLLLTVLATVGYFVGGFTFNGIGLTSINTYNEIETYSVGDADISDRVTSLDINWVCGSVTVRAYDGDTVKVSESGYSDSDDRLRWRLRDGLLTVHFRRSGFSLFSRTSNKSLEILVPRELAADMSEVRTDTVSAEVTLDSLTCAILRADTVSGSISTASVTADKADINTVSGEISLDGSFNEVDADSVSGSMTLITDICPRSLNFDTTSGEAEITLPADSGFTCDVDSVSGDFNSDFAYTRSDDGYTCGDGSANFEFDSVSGDVTLKPANR